MAEYIHVPSGLRVESETELTAPLFKRVEAVDCKAKASKAKKKASKKE